MRLPAGHDEALLDRDSLNYVAPLGQMLVALARPIHEVMQAYRDGGGLRSRRTARISTRARPGSRGRCTSTSSGRSGCRRRGDQRSPPGRSARAGSRRRLRRRHLQHRDRACLPERARRRHRLRPTLIELAKRHLAENPDVAGRIEFHCGDAADPVLPDAMTSSRSSRPCTTCRIRSRRWRPHGGCWRRAARCSSWTSGRPIASRHPPGSSSGFSTAPASSTACSSAWSARGPRAPAR